MTNMSLSQWIIVTNSSILETLHIGHTKCAAKLHHSIYSCLQVYVCRQHLAIHATHSCGRNSYLTKGSVFPKTDIFNLHLFAKSSVTQRSFTTNANRKFEERAFTLCPTRRSALHQLSGILKHYIMIRFQVHVTATESGWGEVVVCCSSS